MDRYILRHHIAPFLFGFSVVVFLFLMQFILKYIDELLGKGLSYFTIVQLIGLNLAWMVVLAVPIGILFSTLLTFGGLSATHEVTIIKASGGSLVRMMVPVVILGMAATVWLFWFNDKVLPDANHKAKTLLSDIQRKKPTFSIIAGQFTSELDGCTILARRVDSASGMMKSVTIYDHRKSNLLNIATADSGMILFNKDYTKLVVTLHHGELHQLTHNMLKDYRKVDFEKYQLFLPASGFSFVRTSEGVMSRGDRELSIIDMERIVTDASKRKDELDKRIRTELNRHWEFINGDSAARANLPTGEELKFTREWRNLTLDSISRVIASRRISQALDSLSLKDSIIDSLSIVDSLAISALKRIDKRVNFLRSTIQSDISQTGGFEEQIRQYQVEIHKKYAIPFACLIFVLVGCPLGIITRGGNFGVSAAITLGFYIFYWACLIGGEKLADRGIIAPFISMWAGNIIIGLMGVILTARVNNESFGISFSNIFKILKQKS